MSQDDEFAKKISEASKAMIKHISLYGLQYLIDEIKNSWPFSFENYSDIASLPGPHKRLMFGIDHVLKHQVKVVGSLAGILEAEEHRVILEDHLPEIRIIVCEMLCNTLRMAEICGMDASSLTKGCVKFIGQNTLLPE